MLDTGSALCIVNGTLTAICQPLEDYLGGVWHFIVKPYQPPDPPPLVMVTTQVTKPFQVTGVDFIGVLCKGTWERDEGVWMSAYWCCYKSSTFGVVTDLSVETFLLALRWFSGWRPTIILDNVFTYLATADELKQLFWKYASKRASWFGGFWEHLIVLTILTMKMLGVTLSITQTLIVEVANMLTFGTLFLSMMIIQEYIGKGTPRVHWYSKSTLWWTSMILQEYIVMD